jgi:cation diffusion facilitator family transporter
MTTIRNSEPDGKIKAAYVSLFSNLLLTISKIAIGTLSGSVSVVSEGAHSASDLMASGLALYTVHIADMPPDATHPYGHGKMESMSALAQAVLLFGIAAYIVYEAISHLIYHAAPQRVDWGMGIMVFSAILNVFVWRYVKRVAERTDSQALHADAQDHRNDIVTAVAVLAGLILGRVTGLAIFDPLLAILVAVVIVHGAWSVGRDAFNTLVDRQLPQIEIDTIKNVFDSEQRVLAYHKLRTRKGGSVRHVDAHVLLDDNLTLVQAHEFSEALELRIRNALPHTVATLHVEPFRAEQLHQRLEHGGVVSDEVCKLPDG